MDYPGRIGHGFLAIALAVLLAVAARAEGVPPAVAAVFSLKAARDGDARLMLNISIAKGNYLYRDSLAATLDGRDLPLETPQGAEKDDPNFGLVEVYHDGLRASLADVPESGQLAIRLQGCAEAGICYPPIVRTIDLATLAVSDPPARAAQEGEAAFAPLDPVPATDDASATMAASPMVMLAGFLGFGLLLAFTPCVFPMIPILSAMLTGAGERLTATRGFALSSAYVLAMAAAYGLVGFAAAWSGANLQALLQTPWVLGFSALVFVALAFSMFGFYELQLPAGLASRLARGKGGSLTGAALLGFGSALIVGPCVTPPLAAAMLYAVQTGEAARGAGALFALGLGMGLPLIAAGTFGAKVLPKSGPWLASIRQGFGVVFLGVALLLATRLMPGPAALAAWGVFAIGAAVFLGAFDRLEAASGADARIGKAAGLVAALYGALMIAGAAGGGDDPIRPLAFLSRPAAMTAAQPQMRVTSLAALESAVSEQAAAGGPVLVSFTADWCTVCKSNERILRQPNLQARLARLPAVTADVTEQGEGERELMSRFSVIGPPVLFLMDGQGREIPGSRLTGPITAEDIAARLATAGV